MADASRAVHWAEFRELAPDIANSAMALFAREGREPRAGSWLRSRPRAGPASVPSVPSSSATVSTLPSRTGRRKLRT